MFAALHLRDHLDAGPLARSLVIGAGVVGALAGVLIAERLLARVAPLPLLLLRAERAQEQKQTRPAR